MGFTAWRNDGRPFRLARPVADLAAILRRYGYTVGTIGNTPHLTARVPEDHTPYSATGWPKPNPYPWVHAGDVMPPPAGEGLPSLAQLGAQIVADRQAGVAGIAWLKYINWTTGDGHCVHDKWTPDYKRTPSDDTEHIHLSARTDHTRVASTYDPVARLRGQHTNPVAKPKPHMPPFPRRVLHLTTPQMRGTDVRIWQQRMKALKYVIDVDGIFGPQSQIVLKKFQRDHKLTVDGFLGPVSWRKAWT